MELDQIREEIKNIDYKILELSKRRLELAREVGANKVETNAAVRNLAVERKVIDRYRGFALENGMVSLEIDYRNRKYVNVPDMCPVCGGDLISVSNSTLDGDTIEIQRRCGRCSYSSGSRGTIPGRYVFIRKSGGLSLSRDDRIERLDRAKELMEEACDILESLIDGHVLAHHAVSTVEILREKISSDGDPGSIRNMRRCLETDEGHPGWTRPLDSVKNVHRKVL